MKLTSIFSALAVVALSVGHASAAPTSQEAAELGKSLTPLGAVKAGNQAGTIPAWDGGLCQAVAGYQPKVGKDGPPWIDPFSDEKPLYSITADNVDKYAALLPAGTQALLKRFPSTDRVDVYPTHRTACFPEYVYKNTIERVMNPKLVGTAPGVSDAHAQFPFPIPKSGHEAMWNALLAFSHPYELTHRVQYIVNSAGTVTFINQASEKQYRPYWDDSRTELSEEEPYWSLISAITEPASKAGQADLRRAYTRADLQDTRAWSYIPGQRRVRQAPEFTYDTVSTLSGVLLFDEINGFDGKMDRFDFELVGRKEMIVPYNAYRRWAGAAQDSYVGSLVKPELRRYELHRVWVVEATLKEGKRHTQKKKVFYLDEDSWTMLAYEAYDHQGALHHYMELPAFQMYEKPAFRGGFYDLYDFPTGILYTNYATDNAGRGTQWTDSFPPNTFTPAGLTGAGVR
jgi:hypothetical protein